MILKDIYGIDSYDKFLNRKAKDFLGLIDEITKKMCSRIAYEVCDSLYGEHKYIVPNEGDLKDKIENLVFDYFSNSTNNISIYIQREKKIIFDNVNVKVEGIFINPDEIIRQSQINQQLLIENFFEEISPVKNMISIIINHINFRNQVNPAFKNLDINIEDNIRKIINEQFNKYNEEFNTYINMIIDSLKNESYQFNSYVYSEKDNNSVKENVKQLSMESIFDDVQNNRDPFRKQNSEIQDEIHSKNTNAFRSIDVSQLTEEQKNELVYGKAEDETLTSGKSK